MEVCLVDVVSLEPLQYRCLASAQRRSVGTNRVGIVRERNVVGTLLTESLVLDDLICRGTLRVYSKVKWSSKVMRMVMCSDWSSSDMTSCGLAFQKSLDLPRIRVLKRLWSKHHPAPPTPPNVYTTNPTEARHPCSSPSPSPVCAVRASRKIPPLMRSSRIYTFNALRYNEAFGTSSKTLVVSRRSLARSDAYIRMLLI